MIIYYRITDISSSNPSPILNDDKFKLNQLCLRSFVSAFKEVKPKMVFICDYTTPQTIEMIRRVVPFEKEIISTGLGINETCLKQYDLFLEQKDEDEVLFSECDYLWLSSSGQKLLDALRKLPYVSPYDHPDKYLLDKKVDIKLVNGKHWRSTPSTTSTFATTRDNFLKQKDIFYKYGYLDKARWEEMGSDVLFTPIPTLATHCVTSQMAPGIDWKEEWEKYL